MKENQFFNKYFFLQIMDTFSNCIHDKDKRQFEEIIVEAMDNLQEFEEELGIRKTPFFGGLYNFILFFFLQISLFSEINLYY